MTTPEYARPKMEGLNVDSLRGDCLNEKPRDYDWSRGYAEEWEIIQPYGFDDFDNSDCPECEGIGEILNKLDEWEKCKKCDGTGEIDLDNEGKTGYYDYENMEESNQPMMNYYYPLPSRRSFDSEDAQKISDLPLCIVYFNESEEYALVLTGGGMDLSWQICEAHMRLGYYPPTHFRLPRLSGKTASPRNLAIVDACIKGREIVQQWQNGDIDDLKRTRENLKAII